VTRKRNLVGCRSSESKSCRSIVYHQQNPSVSTVLPTSTTSAAQSAAFLVGQIYVRQNTTTWLSLQQEHSSADGVSTLQPQQPSGTRFHHISDHGKFRAGLWTPLRTFVEECECTVLHFHIFTPKWLQWLQNVQSFPVNPSYITKPHLLVFSEILSLAELRQLFRHEKLQAWLWR